MDYTFTHTQRETNPIAKVSNEEMSIILIQLKLYKSVLIMRKNVGIFNINIYFIYVPYKKEIDFYPPIINDMTNVWQLKTITSLKMYRK